MEGLSLRKSLIALRAWSHWHRVVSENPKYFPGLSLLKKGFEAAHESLMSESRKTVLRLAKLGRCVSCGVKVNVGSGDHIVPLSRGGPQSAENFMPLCRRCNSSKGSKDLLEWWIGCGRHIKDLNHDALTIYLRLKYRLTSEEELDSPAPWFVHKAVKQAESLLLRNPLMLKYWRSKTHR